MNGKQLKNSILQWAIQGKLVPQDPNDEPASVLLERIRAEKARLVKEGIIKKDKNESIIFRGEDNSHYEKFPDGRVFCIDDEIPFEAPVGWIWERFGNLVFNRDSERIPLSVSERKGLAKKYDYYGASGVIDKVDRPLFNIPLLLVGEDGANLINRSTPIAFIAKGEYWVNNHAHVIDCRRLLELEYLCLYINAIPLTPYVTGTAQPKMNQEKMNSILIAVPPTDEQRRIVKKYNEIEPLISKYSHAQVRMEKLNKDIYEKIKKSILQEAIQGKLVPQEPTDEPASVLLDRIRVEKQKLLKDGKLKKKDIVDSIIFKGDDNKYYENLNGKTLDISEEVPFDLPESWRWCRLGSIVHYRIGKTPPRGETAFWGPGLIPWVSISDMKEYGTIVHTKESVSPKATSLLGQISPRGTLLMSFKLTVGRTAILDIDAYHNEAIISIWPFVDSIALRPYLFYTLPVLANLGDSRDAIKGKTLNTTSINNLLIPLPPSEEQIRIVNRFKDIYRHL